VDYKGVAGVDRGLPGAVLAESVEAVMPKPKRTPTDHCAKEMKRIERMLAKEAARGNR
jgi:hypothetical protein